jgi:hypothetical protein
MKNFRISLAAFALLFAMIAATAFRTAKNDQRTSLTKVWFSFKTNATDPLDPISYFNTESTSQPGCPSTGAMCAILAEPQAGDSQLPEIEGDPALKSHIQAVVADNFESELADVKVRAD